MTSRTRELRAPGPVAGLIAVAAALALGALPAFLVGGLAVQIRADLGLTESQLGAAVTLSFLVGALIGPVGGRLSDRIGARRAVLLGCSLSVMALTGLGLLTFEFWHLIGFLMLAGVSLPFIDPGLAIVITQVAPKSRHGLAFGLKEASVPGATLAAGIAVPAIALTHGWRWAFLLGAIPFAITLAVIPRLDRRADHRASGTRRPATPARPAGLFLVAVAAAAGSTAASGASVFLTETGVAMGLSAAAAGWLLVTGSVAGMLSRLGAGAMADRHPGPRFKIVAWMLAIGAISMGAVSIGGPTFLTMGAVGAFAGGWGWSGLLFLSLVRLNPDTPGAAAGIGLAGLALGNALGPLAFGAIAQYWSFGSAWGAGAVLFGIAAVMMRQAQAALSDRSSALRVD